MKKDLVCNRCGCRVYKSDNPEYKYQCYNCDEDLYSFEVSERAADAPPKRIMVGYMADGRLERFVDKDDRPLIFNNKAEAELHLLSSNIPPSEFKYLRFLEVA